jgi:predicted kinase
MTHPTLIIVTGAPATGKSTLAHRLADTYKLPLFTKDGFKENLADSLNRPMEIRMAEWSNLLGASSYQLIYHVMGVMLRAGQSFIIEANFHPAIANAVLRGILDSYPNRAIQISCRADPDVIMRRFRERINTGNLHPIHRYEIFLRDQLDDALQSGTYDPLDIPGERLSYDTTAFDPDTEDRLVQQIGRLLSE